MQLTLPMAIRRPGLAVPSRLATWILCWIVLPNLPFMAMWVVGGPPRYPEILAAGTVGLIVRKARFPIKFAAFSLMPATAISDGNMKNVPPPAIALTAAAKHATKGRIR